MTLDFKIAPFYNSKTHCRLIWAEGKLQKCLKIDQDFIFEHLSFSITGDYKNI